MFYLSHTSDRFPCRILTALFLFTTIASSAQEKPAPPALHDSNYYKIYPQTITGRVYLSRKYTSLSLEGKDRRKPMRYRPNTPVTMGVGATYGIVTINVGFPISFLSRDREETGRSKYLDLQSHVYAKKWVIDLYGQFYKGYYATPKGSGSLRPDSFYVRPDIRVNLMGASVYRLINGDRFSYRAAFLQNEWQRKSAGSLLVGAEAYTGVIKGDSALIPNHLSSSYRQYDINRVRFTEFGPGIGYAYTHVHNENYFVTGSLTATGDISFVREFKGTTSAQRTSVSPNLMLRIVAGYNSDDWMLNLAWVNSSTNLRGKSSNDQYLISIGSFRLGVAKRIVPGNKLKKRLQLIDDLPVPQM